VSILIRGKRPFHLNHFQLILTSFFTGSTAPLGLGLFFSFMIIFTDGRTPWASDQLVARPLPKYRTTQTQNKHTHQTSMSGVEFEPTIPAFERTKTVHVFDRSATVTGIVTRRVQSWGSSLCCFMHHPVTSSVLDPSIPPRSLFTTPPPPPSLSSSLNVRDQVTHPNECLTLAFRRHIMFVRLYNMGCLGISKPEASWNVRRIWYGINTVNLKVTNVTVIMRRSVCHWSRGS
jgi:hypothetical protein